MVTLEQFKQNNLGMSKRPRDPARTISGSNMYAENYLEQVSRRAAGEVAWVETDTQDLISERTLRQCVHCQKTWPYMPGSGTKYEFCFKCDGIVCDKPVFATCYPKEQFLDDLELAVGEWGPVHKQIEALVRQQVWRERVFNDHKRFRTTL